MKEVYLTQEGLEELKQRLDYLIVYLREDVAKKLQHARELGDLSENAEYDAAKQEESQVASEIKELEERIRSKEATGEYVYEHRVKKVHLSKEKADEWLLDNIGEKSEVVYVHQHIEKGEQNCLK